ncbi:MAG: hypothetical protein J1G01_00800 [Clostridiales bacterium]|nr:hypothetical protein [Clostridiales bacterium]
MKKKIISLVAAATCAATCAFGVVACGDGGDTAPQKAHSETQWKSAFNAAINVRDYRLVQQYFDEEIDSYRQSEELLYDANNRAYVYTNHVYGSTDVLFKKDSRYYKGDYVSVELVTEEYFERRVAYYNEYYDALVERLLKLYRDNYAKFDTPGGYGTEDQDDVIVKFYDYYWKNSSLTIQGMVPSEENKDEYVPGDIEYSIESVKVSITEGGYLREIEIDGITNEYDDVEMKFNYYGSSGAQKYIETANPIIPEVFGNTFRLNSIDVEANVSADELENYKNWAGQVCENNIGKYVLCKADGTLEGDITLDGKQIGDYTLTENYGQITVTDGDVTLTGVCVADKSFGAVTIILKQTIKAMDGTTDVEFTYTFIQVDIG